MQQTCRILNGGRGCLGTQRQQSIDGGYVWSSLEEFFVEDGLVGEGGGDEGCEDGEGKPRCAHDRSED